MYDWANGVRSSTEANNFPLAFVSRPALRLTQSPILWVLESFP
jgi:hypothetical protein